MAKRFGGIELGDLKIFKRRTFKALENGDIESKIREVCKAVNKHPGATTVWACEGHGPYSKKNAPNNCNIVIVVAVGYEHLLDEFIGELMASTIAPLWTLSLTRLQYPDDDFGVLEELTLSDTYNAWQISYGFLFAEPVLREVRKILLSAANKVFRSK